MREDKFKFLKIILGLLITLDILLWGLILFPAEANNLEIYFLDVGQGDSSLVNLPGGIQVLIDGGPINGRVQENLEKILAFNDRYIDLVMISHPQLDHFGGLIEVLKNYEVGAVVPSGAISQSAAWQELEKVIKEKGINLITLAAGDKIKYQDSQFSILSPNKSEWQKDINDLSLVALFEHSHVPKNIRMRVLFTGDIGSSKEKQLVNLYDLDIDVLKVSHHGSKYSSDLGFLKEASPLVSVIEVGKNSYGHPTKAVLNKLASIGSQIYRTDKNGMVKVAFNKGRLRVYTIR